MNGINQAMAEATRLTRTGQLHEATTLIRRALQGGIAPAASPANADASADDIIDAEFTVIAPDPSATVGPDRADHKAQETAPPASTGRRKPASLDALMGSLKNPLGKSAMRPEPDRSNPDVWAGGRFIGDVFTHPAGTRHYKLYIPGGHRGQALPLVVLLHGCTQNADDFAAGTRMNALAEREGFLVLYPEQANAANPSRCWNWFKASDQLRERGEPALLAGLTQHIIRTHGLDARRVYVAGMSAGGAMAMVLGATHPDLYAAIGVHSGLPYAAAHDLPSALAAMRQDQPNLPGAMRGDDGNAILHPVPAIVFHGDRDATVHPGNGDRVLAQWTKAHAGGGRAKLRMRAQRGQVPGGHGYTRSRYHDPDDRVVLEHWLIHGAGHAWSGGSPSGSYTDPEGPDASDAMLRFFLGHARDPA